MLTKIKAFGPKLSGTQSGLSTDEAPSTQETADDLDTDNDSPEVLALRAKVDGLQSSLDDVTSMTCPEVSADPEGTSDKISTL